MKETIESLKRDIQMYGACACLGPQPGCADCPCGLLLTKRKSFKGRERWEKENITWILLYIQRKFDEMEDPAAEVLIEKMYEVFKSSPPTKEE